jgi:hypothetical protein
MREEIVARLLEPEPDLALAGVERRPGGLARKVRRARADVVVLGRDDPKLIRELLQRCPETTVLAVGEEEGRAMLYALKPERTLIGQLTPQRFAAALRTAVGQASEWWEQ